MQDARKHKDNLSDQAGAPLYGTEPAPPFLGVVEQMVFLCWTVDPGRARALLPRGLTLTAGAGVVMAGMHSRAIGWGMKNTDWAFVAPMINEFPAPDTAEACFIPTGLVSDPAAADRIARHFHPSVQGAYHVEAENGLIHAELSIAGRPALRATIAPGSEVNPDMSSLDRYLSQDGRGDLVTFVVSSQGTAQPARLVEVQILPDAPPEWQALAPVRLNWGLWIPEMIFNISVPLPCLATPEHGGSRAALMQIFDRQGRACGIVAGDGRILHANAALGHRIASHPALAGSRITLPPANQDPASAGQFVLPGDPPLLAQFLPVDPDLAGPDTALLLVQDLQETGTPARTEILQLLGLTAAEARIAATVGAGLPPREAAIRLGLTENTVRSGLKVIFGKLGLNRQAERARLIARLSL